MSTRVTDPEGTDWDVSREWLRLPGWSRRRVKVDPLDLLQGTPEPAWVADSPVTLVVILLLLVLLSVVLIVLAPLLFFVVGLVVAIGTLGARLLSLGTWRVQAKAGERRLVWRVQGPLRSARAVRDVASALTRGEEPLVEGRPPDAVAPSV